MRQRAQSAAGAIGSKAEEKCRPGAMLFQKRSETRNRVLGATQSGYLDTEGELHETRYSAVAQRCASR